MITTPRLTTMLAFGLLALAACGSDPSGERVARGSAATTDRPGSALPAGLTPLAAAQLDSGNVAFRLKQFGQAQAFYERAARSVPAHPAPWYGIYMVAQAQGQTGLADSALAMVAQRSGGGELLQQSVSQQHGQVAGPNGADAASAAAVAAHAAAAGPATGRAGALPVAARHPVLSARR